MKFIKRLVFVFFSAFLLISCQKDEFTPLDHPFVHIMRNDMDEVRVASNRRDVVAYYIYFSSKPVSEDLEVVYSIIPGSGLKEGRDYQVITTENPMIFPPGIYQRPIQIKWLDHKLDPTKDNTLQIVLESNNLGVFMGIPYDGNQREFTIIKFNN